MNYQMRRKFQTARTLLLIAGIFGLAIVLGVPAKAAEQYIAAEDNGQIAFIMPSGNIGCVYTPAGGTETYSTLDGGAELQCDRVAPSYVRVVLSASGATQRINNPGEQPCCSIEPKLAYGNTWRAGPFQCISETRGLTCVRDENTGFVLSRAQIIVK
ncbi:hypothetical protein [Devosia sp.]|uniref:hypothetical protein n=1 Tax=Devosia sp. TaxID=1871048 RepID=UPI003264B132